MDPNRRSDGFGNPDTAPSSFNGGLRSRAALNASLLLFFFFFFYGHDEAWAEELRLSRWVGKEASVIGGVVLV